MRTVVFNFSFKQVLCAGVASAALITGIGQATAGGVSVSVAGHSVVSVGSGSLGGAVGGAVGGLGSSVGGAVGGLSSGVGGVSSGLGGGSGFFSGGAHFGPHNATGPNFFSGGAEFRPTRPSHTGRTRHIARRHASPRHETAQEHHRRRVVHERTVSVGGKKGMKATLSDQPQAKVQLGDGHSKGATADLKLDTSGQSTPLTTTVQGFNAPSSETGSTGKAGIASTNVGVLNGADTRTGSDNGNGTPLADTNVGVLNRAGGTTGCVLEKLRAAR